jgi:hypothetical protein
MEFPLTVDVCDFLEDADEAFLLNLTFNHEMLANQIHVGCCLSYRNMKETYKVRELLVIWIVESSSSEVPSACCSLIQIPHQ